jgi:phosphoadenosine phosphosulfate reductase
VARGADVKEFEPLTRHSKIALCFSGGKDSLACVHLLKEHLDNVTIYHLDTGDLLPEMMDSVARVEAFAPHFVRVTTDVAAFIERFGLPTDLLPHSSHPIGRKMGEYTTRLIGRYDCCWINLMQPLYQRVLADGNTLLIRGTKAVDMNRLPLQSGELSDGIELYYPLQDWSNAAVLAFLHQHDIPVPRLYDYMVNAPECARCSAWWGEGRAAYLKRFYPALWDEYADRLRAVAAEIAAPLANLRREAEVS